MDKDDLGAKLSEAADRVEEFFNTITYLRCEHGFVHPISEKTRKRLARDCARAALGL